MIPADPQFTGIFAIFVARSTAYLWEVKRYGVCGMDIRRKKELSYVNHYYFHIIDQDWGHITVKICAHPPFKAQIFVNGHEWVAGRPETIGLELEKQDNCFTDYKSGADLTRLADTLKYQGQLDKLCDRWIYKCLWFALPYADQKRSQFKYQYSIFQIEHSRNLLFQRGRFLDQTFQGIIDLTRSKLDMKRLRTMFGRKRRAYEGPKTRASRRSRTCTLGAALL